MSHTTPSPSLSVEEYLRLEHASERRHEYVAGRAYALSAPSRRHNQVVWNVLHRLKAATRGGPCEVYFEGVKVRVADDVIYCPDVMVVCVPQHDEYVAESPCLVVEVTSPSTASIDRREKVTNYRRIPSLQTYIVVDQRRRRVDRHWRDARGEWWHVTVAGNGEVPLPCPELTLTLDEIYEGVQTLVGEGEPDEYELEEEDEAEYDG
jgi:Uma2 family endonuclease